MSARAHSADRCHCCARMNEPVCAAACPWKGCETRPREVIADHASAGAPLVGVLSRWRAQRAVDLAFRAEAEGGVDTQRAGDGVFEIDAMRCRLDLFQPETCRQIGAEPRSPVAFELAPAAMIMLRAVARAFDLRIVRIEVEQHREVARPAGVHPVDDNTHLIEITHAAFLFCRGQTQTRLRITVVNMC